MAEYERKVDWCLKKAGKELESGRKHRGLVIIRPDKSKALQHIAKAEHNLNAITDFKKMGYSDWSASAAFYTIYHCFLAIIVKNGYESRNQECTFALIHHLIDTKQLNLEHSTIDIIHGLHASEEEPTITDIREIEQYGISTTLDSNTYSRVLSLAKKILDTAKEIIQE